MVIGPLDKAEKPDVQAKVTKKFEVAKVMEEFEVVKVMKEFEVANVMQSAIVTVPRLCQKVQAFMSRLAGSHRMRAEVYFKYKAWTASVRGRL